MQNINKQHLLKASFYAFYGCATLKIRNESKRVAYINERTDMVHFHACYHPLECDSYLKGYSLGGNMIHFQNSVDPA